MNGKCFCQAVKGKKTVNEVSFHHDLDSLRTAASTAIDSFAAELGKISHDIWSNPELSYQVA